jgi:hypothetical protein
MRPQAFLLMFLLLADSTATFARSHKSPKLEGLDYDKARAIILGYGWTPFAGQCQGDATTCKRYPELHYCQGVSPGYCDLKFAKDKRCLILTTLESPPGTSKDDTWVKDVTFHRGPCWKDPS